MRACSQHSPAMARLGARDRRSIIRSLADPAVLGSNVSGVEKVLEAALAISRALSRSTMRSVVTGASLLADRRQYIFHPLVREFHAVGSNGRGNSP